MPVRTSYSDEGEMIDYLNLEMGDVLSSLGWVDANTARIEQAIRNALRLMPVQDIAQITDVRRLELVAIQEMWRIVLRSYVLRHDHSNSGNTFNQSAMYKQAMEQFKIAQAAVAEHDAMVAETDDVVDGSGGDLIIETLNWPLQDRVRSRPTIRFQPHGPG